MKVAHRYVPDKALLSVLWQEEEQKQPSPSLSLSSGDGPGTGQSSGKHFWNGYLVKY